jgi:hypothetical protein
VLFWVCNIWVLVEYLILFVVVVVVIIVFFFFFGVKENFGCLIKVGMESSGEVIDDQGSGWFQVKKVSLFIHFISLNS